MPAIGNISLFRLPELNSKCHFVVELTEVMGRVTRLWGVQKYLLLIVKLEIKYEDSHVA
jgi:hypothetical protein